MYHMKDRQSWGWIHGQFETAKKPPRWEGTELPSLIALGEEKDEQTVFFTLKT